MASNIHTIALPSRPQPDTLVAILLLKEYGDRHFPGIKSAMLEVMPTLSGGDDASYEENGVLLVDIGGGRFDHHEKMPKTTTSKLVADYLDIAKKPALSKLLEYAERDDFYGKGTISSDSIDRAFGFSGMVAALNKQHPQDPNFVMSTTIPMLAAHHHEEIQRSETLPREFSEKKADGSVIEFDVKQRGKKLKVVAVKSDNPSLAGFLRSQIGGRYDVVIQHAITGHTNILTRPTKRVELSGLAVAIRIKEAEKRLIDIENVPYAELSKSGRFQKIKEWYYDRATNSIQNGGLSPGEVEATQIAWNEFEGIVREGLGDGFLA
jgi:hypothetical protein